MLAYVGASLAILGLSWRHLGSILAPTWPSWLHLGALLGLSWRIFGHLGAILAPYWLQCGHPGSILVFSWAYLGMSLALTLPIWMSRSRTSELFSSLFAPLTSTSDLHLLQHLSIVPVTASSSLIWATQLHISVAHLNCTSQSHLSFGPLSFSS